MLLFMGADDDDDNPPEQENTNSDDISSDILSLHALSNVLKNGLNHLVDPWTVVYSSLVCNNKPLGP